MCGRYTSYIEESNELKTIYDLVRAEYPEEELHEGEIYPTNNVPLLGARNGTLLPFPAVWGFPGYRGKEVIINARAETAPQRLTFADSFRNRRCIVPTTGYFEWSAEKRKYLFRQPEKKILYLAGLYTPLYRQHAVRGADHSGERIGRGGASSDAGGIGGERA